MVLVTSVVYFQRMAIAIIFQQFEFTILDFSSVHENQPCLLVFTISHLSHVHDLVLKHTLGIPEPLNVDRNIFSHSKFMSLCKNQQINQMFIYKMNDVKYVKYLL